MASPSQVMKNSWIFLESPKGWVGHVGHVVSQPLSSGSRIFHHPPKGQSFQDSKPMMLEKVRHDF